MSRHAFLVRSLAAATAEAPAGRKLLLAPRRGLGKELLRTLARSGTSWLGWEVLTLRPLALELAAPGLAAAGRVVVDELAEQAMLDAALDEALEEVGEGGLAALAEGVGFRGAVREAVKALRLADVGVDRLAAVPLGDGQKRDLLAAALRAYGARLDRPVDDGRRRVDTAFVLREAADALAAGAPTGYDRIRITPGVGRRGLAGRLVDGLLRRGATVLRGDPVVGLDPPPGRLWAAGPAESPLSFLHEPGSAPVDGPVAVDIFHAASVTDELREVLRRVVAAGAAWDEVEIVSTDAGVYGPALHALAGRMGVPVTFGVGLPVERTRAGQAVEHFFRWIQDDFPSPIVRRLLETGILRPPEPHREADGGALARRLRGLRVGWGRDRYLPAVDAAIDARSGPVRPRRNESREDASRRASRERRQLEALRAVLAPVLEAVPPVPARLDPDPPRVAPGALAGALLVFLEHVPGEGEVDRTALDRLRRILRRAEAELERPTDFASAVAILREHLAIRVPAPRAEGPAPWRSQGGHLYLTDLQNGGASGRRHTFVVGLDAGRTSAGALQDPLLLDVERKALDPDALPTSATRIEDFRFGLAALLAGLRGAVTLSYAAWDPGEARGLLPSPLLLQAHRLRTADPGAGFADLRESLGDPVSPVPRGPAGRSSPVDAADVWLDGLTREGELLEGSVRVREAYPDLDRGLRARDALAGPPSSHHGVVRPRPELDPRRGDQILSASRLETLGACPRRYFLAYVLGVRPPRDPTMDPDAWLDALDRGSLLHTVYERTLRETRAAEIGPEEPAFADHALEVLEDEAERQERSTPPPSRVVLEREMEALRADVRAFVAMVRADGDRWLEAELSFGMPRDDRDPVELAVPGGTIRVRGAIDRVDEVAGGLRLVDYKTGRNPDRYRDGGTWDGGRRLQHVLYTKAAAAIYGRPVHGLAYHFPTRQAENAVIPYHASQVSGGLGLVARLLDGVAAGRFVPTEEPRDCQWCDYRAVCRVTGDFRRIRSPLAEWAAERFEDDEAFDALREARRWTG